MLPHASKTAVASIPLTLFMSSFVGGAAFATPQASIRNVQLQVAFKARGISPDGRLVGNAIPTRHSIRTPRIAVSLPHFARTLFRTGSISAKCICRPQGHSHRSNACYHFSIFRVLFFGNLQSRMKLTGVRAADTVAFLIFVHICSGRRV